MGDYLEEMLRRFWEYRAAEFQGDDGLFDQRERRGSRPPVFTRRNAFRNILTTNPCLDEVQRRRLIDMIPAEKRHRWFGSMKSSQALAQSVFGTLAVMGKVSLLAEVPSVGVVNTFPFRLGSEGQAEIRLESEVEHLNEPRRTSMDVHFKGACCVAVECKLGEPDVGHCSRPSLSAADFQHCDGNYAVQHERIERCALSHRGVQYWDYLPLLFNIDPEIDHLPCPIKSTYQLIRNLLGVCIRSNGTVAPSATVVLLYDDRNPSFQQDGRAHNAFNQVQAILHEPAQLQRCTWQSLVKVLLKDRELNWLTDHLGRKYGFC